MQNIVSFMCPKCNNNHSFYKYGKDINGFQKYLCQVCNHQFVPGKPSRNKSNYPKCPVCGKGSFLHHDHQHYSNYRCGDKRCYHSFFVPKAVSFGLSSSSNVFGKLNFKRMRHSIHLIISAISMFNLGKNSFRNISLIFKTLFNANVSHTAISKWCKNFAPVFQSIGLKLVPTLNFNSDEWHADETVVKINGVKHYIWFIIDSETRFVLGFHLSPYRNSPQAFSLLNSVKELGSPKSIVSDRYSAYKIPIKSVFQNVKHIQVESFKADISNNLIESFNHQFKAWYKTKQGFNSFHSANNLITTFIFFFNFVRPHSALNHFTPAQVAGLNLSKKQKKEYLVVR